MGILAHILTVQGRCEIERTRLENDAKRRHWRNAKTKQQPATLEYNALHAPSGKVVVVSGCRVRLMTVLGSVTGIAGCAGTRQLSRHHASRNWVTCRARWHWRLLTLTLIVPAPGGEVRVIIRGVLIRVIIRGDLIRLFCVVLLLTEPQVSLAGIGAGQSAALTCS